LILHSFIPKTQYGVLKYAGKSGIRPNSSGGQRLSGMLNFSDVNGMIPNLSWNSLNVEGEDARVSTVG
jgi:hypothetical protein